ncbi:MAG: ankyrin repeat domain-containing protein [Micavibrio sp.]|nr:ankyrin repeat domain-containing protein [Micavibrio sp.]
MGFELDMDDYWDGNRQPAQSPKTTVTTELPDFAARGDLDAVKAAVSLGADVTHDRSRALRRAAAEGHADICEFLIGKGADVHALGDEALRFAVTNNRDLAVIRLLRLGAGADAMEGEALIKAATSGNANIVQALLAAGADPNGSDAQALRKASFNGHDLVVRHLLRAGADAFAMGGHALSLADQDKHELVVQLLAEAMHEQRAAFFEALKNAPDVKTFLRTPYAGDMASGGECGLMRAAKMNCLQKVVERMKETGDRLTYDDLHGFKDRSGRSLATVAADHYHLKDLFDVTLWRGDIDGLKSAWDKIAKPVQANSGITADDFATMVAEHHQRTLKDKAGKFKLK